MKLGKLKMFFVLNGMIFFVFIVYLATWLLAQNTEAKITGPYSASTIHVVYTVEGRNYQASFLRNDIPFSQRRISILYLPFRPGSSRIYSFMGLAAEPLGWWLVFLIASSMLLLTDNPVFSKGTLFRLQKKFPWISMEEYFPLEWWEKDQPGEKERPTRKKIFKKLKGNS